MDVTLPNGQVIRGVPDGTPKDIIMQRAISSGMATRADFPSEEIQPPIISEAPNERTIPEKVMGGISGAASVVSDTIGSSVGGLTALVDTLNPFTDNNPEELINQIKAKFKIDPNEGGQAGLDKMASILEPAAPMINAVSDFKKKAGQQGLDLTGSPAFATFVQMIPDILAEASGFGVAKKVAKTKEFKPVIDEAKYNAIKESDKLEDLTGIRELTSDVTPPETRIGKLMQSQGELVAGFQRKGQQTQRVRAIERLANQYDVVEGAGFESKIVKGLKDSVQASKQAIGKLYEESTAKLDTLGNVPLNNTKLFAQEIIDREMKKGTLSNQGIIDDMTSLIEAPDDLSFELVKEIRSAVGANLEKVKRGAPVQGNSDTGILKRTYGRLTNDLTKFAEAADPELASKWVKANKTMEEFAIGANKTGAKSIIRNGDATPEVVDTLLFSSKNSDVDFLAKNLDEAGKQAAKQRVIQRALEKSSIDGDDINPNKFLSQLNKSKSQINKLFSKSESEALLALRGQLSKTFRAQNASVTTPTGQQLTLAAAMAVPVALIPGITQGIIESKVIRDLVIKRKAAKSARDLVVIDKEIKSKLNELGLGGALATGSVISKEEE